MQLNIYATVLLGSSHNHWKQAVQWHCYPSRSALKPCCHWCGLAHQCNDLVFCRFINAGKHSIFCSKYLEAILDCNNSQQKFFILFLTIKHVELIYQKTAVYRGNTESGIFISSDFHLSSRSPALQSETVTYRLFDGTEVESSRAFHVDQSNAKCQRKEIESTIFSRTKAVLALLLETASRGRCIDEAQEDGRGTFS